LRAGRALLAPLAFPLRGVRALILAPLRSARVACRVPLPFVRLRLTAGEGVRSLRSLPSARFPLARGSYRSALASGFPLKRGNTLFPRSRTIGVFLFSPLPASLPSVARFGAWLGGWSFPPPLGVASAGARGGFPPLTYPPEHLFGGQKSPSSQAFFLLKKKILFYHAKRLICRKKGKTKRRLSC